MVFYEILGQIHPKIKITPKFMFDISSISILTLISDKRFMEHLSQVMPKLVPVFESQSRKL